MRLIFLHLKEFRYKESCIFSATLFFFFPSSLFFPGRLFEYVDQYSVSTGTKTIKVTEKQCRFFPVLYFLSLLHLIHRL